MQGTLPPPDPSGVPRGDREDDHEGLIGAAAQPGMGRLLGPEHGQIQLSASKTSARACPSPRWRGSSGPRRRARPLQCPGDQVDDPARGVPRRPWPWRPGSAAWLPPRIPESRSDLSTATLHGRRGQFRHADWRRRRATSPAVPASTPGPISERRRWSRAGERRQFRCGCRSRVATAAIHGRRTGAASADRRRLRSTAAVAPRNCGRRRVVDARSRTPGPRRRFVDGACRRSETAAVDRRSTQARHGERRLLRAWT